MTAPVPNSRLSSYVSRIEARDQDRQLAANDIKEIFAEAKNDGFDPKIIRKCLKRRATDPKKAEQEEALIDTYMAEPETLPLPF